MIALAGFLWRPALLLAAAAALFAGGWWKGSESVKADWQAANEAAKTAAETERRTHQSAIDGLTRKLAAKQAASTSAANLAKVDNYAPASLPLLPPSFRVWFDATATGTEVDPSRVADAAPVAPREVARASGVNNAIARENADHVEALQAVIRASGCFQIEGE